MSRRDRHDGDRRSDRRDSQPDDEQQRRSAGEIDLQESDSLTALKAILSKVAGLLNPLQLTQDESIRLVEQLYGSVLETDVRLAGEADDTRKSSILAYIQNTSITREGGKIVVQHQVTKEEPAAQEPPKEPAGETAPKQAAPKDTTPAFAAAPAAPPAAPREAAAPAAPDQQPDADAPKPAPKAKERTARPAKPRAATGTRPAASRASAARATEAAAADSPTADPPADPPAEAPTAAE